jgi:hypothetical protein
MLGSFAAQDTMLGALRAGKKFTKSQKTLKKGNFPNLRHACAVETVANNLRITRHYRSISANLTLSGAGTMQFIACYACCCCRCLSAAGLVLCHRNSRVKVTHFYISFSSSRQSCKFQIDRIDIDRDIDYRFSSVVLSERE